MFLQLFCHGVEVPLQAQKDTRYGMFFCWSFSTLSGTKWTDPADNDVSFLKATGWDTDQWARSARPGYSIS